MTDAPRSNAADVELHPELVADAKEGNTMSNESDPKRRTEPTKLGEIVSGILDQVIEKNTFQGLAVALEHSPTLACYLHGQNDSLGVRVVLVQTIPWVLLGLLPQADGSVQTAAMVTAPDRYQSDAEKLAANLDKVASKS